MRWTVLRRFAISLFCWSRLALPRAARTRPHYGGSLRVEIEGDPWQRPGWHRAAAGPRRAHCARCGWQCAARLSQSSGQSDDNDHRWQFRLAARRPFSRRLAAHFDCVVMSLNHRCTANCPWTAVHAVGSSVVFTSDSPMPNLPALLASDEFLIALTRHGRRADAGQRHRHGTVSVHEFQQRRAHARCQRQLLAGPAVCRRDRTIRGNRADSRSMARPERGPRRHGRSSCRGAAPGAAAAAHRGRSRRRWSCLRLQVSDSGALANPVLRAAIAAGCRSQRALQCDLSKAGRDHCQPFAAVAHRLRVSLSHRTAT